MLRPRRIIIFTALSIFVRLVNFLEPSYSSCAEYHYLIEVSGFDYFRRIGRNERVGGEVVDDRFEGQRKKFRLLELEVDLLQRSGVGL
jgi:hypothetical protein